MTRGFSLERLGLRAGFGRWFLLLVVAYLLTRGIGLLSFVPHNDEMIYTQYAQLIADSWEENRFISMDGRMFGDYKPPLHYWLASLTVDWWSNPLIGVRLWSLLLGLTGLTFACGLVGRLAGRAAALATGVLVILSESALYFDSVALAEVLVYGLGAAYLFLLAGFLDSPRLHWQQLLGATLALGLALLAKRLALVFVPLGALLLAGLFLASRRPTDGDQGAGRAGWPNLMVRFAATALGAQAFFLIVVPSRFELVRRASLGASQTRSLGELWPFPLADVTNSIHFFLLDIVAADYGWVTLVLAAAVLWELVAGRSRRQLGLLLVMLATGVLGVAIAGRADFARYMSPILFLWYACAGTALVGLLGRLPKCVRTVVVVTAVVAAVALSVTTSIVPLLATGQTAFVHVETDPDSWANGAGIPELIDSLAALPPGVLLYDVQWGHPGTAVQVFSGSRFPEMRLLPLTAQAISTAAAESSSSGLPVYAAYDSGRPDRPRYQEMVERRGQLLRRIVKSFRNRQFTDTELTIWQLEPSG